ncbi:hypothetical protein CONPUDRAFT_62163 [Coniophora puteana RWD-64-598 SS2]|uniref:Transcription and mRNA export factor SUS1 n=1 Tax=Coniophora puteana (strain RWD-64-598) TaxID=741705 RepID=A0A5M3MF39_CONPW|nr:uncharacterized protein CONPUDRAFT_62163 [Coniophora puteana RWD-64-598 SS2]EIW77832.1 hypothetical protein CONPUDRAFT_62163 [Coniophora puteana RWD-64-598 SS2]
MGKADANANASYSQVHKRFIESGEWDRIMTVMSSKLNDSGWIDELHDQAKERARTLEQPSFQTILEELGPQGLNSVPLAVKRDIMNLIRQYVEKQVDK